MPVLEMQRLMILMLVVVQQQPLPVQEMQQEVLLLLIPVLEMHQPVQRMQQLVPVRHHNSLVMSMLLQPQRVQTVQQQMQKL